MDMSMSYIEPPHSSVACINARKGRVWYQGTGFLVKHNNDFFVITAGHNLFSRRLNQLASCVKVTLGRNGNERPFGVIVKTSKDVDVPEQLKDGQCGFDYGIILLNVDIDELDKSNYFVIDERNMKSIKRHSTFMCGYPGPPKVKRNHTGRTVADESGDCRKYERTSDRETEGQLSDEGTSETPNGQKTESREWTQESVLGVGSIPGSPNGSQWEMELTNVEIRRRRLLYKDKTRNGMSGAPVYMVCQGQHIAYGVHITGFVGEIGYNSATRITAAVKSSMEQMVYDIKCKQ